MQSPNNLTSTGIRKPGTTEERLRIEHLLTPTALLETELTLGSDIVSGLSESPKSLPPRYFYDDRGSMLFERICELPEYYVTRTEAAILRGCAGEIAELTGECEIAELGSGSSTKTRILLDAYSELGYRLRYLPIDVSAGILESSARALLADYPQLEVHGLVSTYELALSKLAPSPLKARMICFIGSSLGNLKRQECDVFLSQIAGALQAGDFFLLGIDLHKSKEVLEPAYSDAQGVTAEFNLNMLRHLNWRFEGNFDPSQFEHWAFYNEGQRQIEMHLRSLRAQNVRLRALDLSVELGAGETILTEISRKFDLDEMREYLQGRGLVPVRVWTDPQRWVGLLLCQRLP
ncbi:L-histidine N(alpha)-methyltransferase [Kamptonema formosum]|uniref:L-histidine N(alpha)-methyltransferase n=1 Tax=Kamptonema formosum TaxID=331992 RepID=UPI0003468EE3|nr:L-histidine N(alpha)-methyltransferase [Oscillatoria sp. PCC 10802]